MFNELKCDECSTDRQAIKTLEEKIYTHHEVENKKFGRWVHIACAGYFLFLISLSLYMAYSLSTTPVIK